MQTITLYTTNWCGYCMRAKALLDARKLPYTEVNLDSEPGFRQKLVEMTGRMTVPQIFVGDQPIGGYQELAGMDRSGELRTLVEAA